MIYTLSLHDALPISFYELLSSKIIEWDEAIDRQPLPHGGPIDEGYFTKIEEKMVIDFTIKVLQNQQVRISSTMNDHDWDHECEWLGGKMWTQ